MRPARAARVLVAVLVGVLAGSRGLPAQTAAPPAPPRLDPADVFDLEWAADPQVSRDGRRVV